MDLPVPCSVHRFQIAFDIGNKKLQKKCNTNFHSCKFSLSFGYMGVRKDFCSAGQKMTKSSLQKAACKESSGNR